MLLYDDTDNGTAWQHRILLRCLKTKMVNWIPATPDLAVQCEDLSEYTVRTLGGKVPLPEDAIDEGCHAFDPLESDEYRGLLAEA